jgi:predicted ester cyclase
MRRIENGADMSATPTEVAQRWFQEVWNERKHSTIGELMHPSAVGHTSSGETRGPEDWKKRVWNLLTGAFSDIKLAVDGMVAVDETVVVRWRATMLHTGHALGIPPSQNPVAIHGITWLTVRDGKIVEGWDGWDATGMFAQCGGVTLDPRLPK